MPSAPLPPPFSGSLRHRSLGRVLGRVWGSEGTLHLKAGSTSILLQLRNGRLAQVRGLTGLLPGAGDADELDRQVEIRLAQGHWPEEVTEEATRGLGDALSAYCVPCDVSYAWEPGEVALARTGVQPEVVRVLDVALRRAGSVDRGRDLVERRGGDLVRADAAAAESDALRSAGSIALRVFKLASDPIFLRDLVAQATGPTGARRPEVLHRIVLLLEFDLLCFDLQDSAGSYAVSPSGQATGQDLEDPRITELETKAIHLTGLGYFARLGLEASEHQPTPEEIASAFRTVSAQFHPDRFVGEPALLQRRAAECFAVVNDAYVSLREPGVAKEEWQRITCEREGVPFVSDRDRVVAARSWKQAETRFEQKDYAVAEACYAEASRRDPTNARYQVQHMWCAYLARQVDAAEALSRIEAATPTSQLERSRFVYLAGQVAKLSGAPEAEWVSRFERALELNPENRDAARELWLHRQRTEHARPPAHPLVRWPRSLLDRLRRSWLRIVERLRRHRS